MGFQFASSAKPALPIVSVHSVAKPSGLITLQAKCKFKGHRNCSCWVTHTVEGRDKDLLLENMMRWAAKATDDSDAHKLQAYELKVQYGMKPKKAKL